MSAYDKAVPKLATYLSAKSETSFETTEVAVRINRLLVIMILKVVQDKKHSRLQKRRRLLS